MEQRQIHDSTLSVDGNGFNSFDYLVYCEVTMTLSIAGDSDTVTLTDPFGIAEMSTEKIATHVFSDNSYVAHHTGRSSEGLIITGIQRGSDVYTKMSDIKAIMDNAEEVTISGLSDSNLNGDYRIANLEKRRQTSDGLCVRYTLSLEKKQEAE